MNLFRSIRWRFQLWYGLLLVLVLCGFGVTAYHLQSGQRLRQLDGDLQRRLSVVAGAMKGTGPRIPPPPRGMPPPPRRQFRLSPEDAALFGEQGTRSFYYMIWLRNGPPLTRSANAPEGLAPPHPDEPSPRQRGPFREVFLHPEPMDCILVGCSLEAEEAELRVLKWRLVAAGAAVLVLGLLGGWWLGAHALRPLGQIGAAARKIAEGNLAQRIPSEAAGGELKELVEVLNSTFARLEEAFAQQTRFTSDAAHELRTPVTVLLTEAQSVLNRERSPEEYRQCIETCQRAAQRMRRLIESLLQLARLDAHQAEIAQVRFNFGAICAECIELLQPLARERHVKLATHLPAIECVGDPERLSQVVVNLVTNAIQHNRAGDEVQVTLMRENGSVVLLVADNGRGIPSDKLPHIFERFYRGDASRSRRTASGGLGLAIARAIVEAHHGEIGATSQVEKGTAMAVRLPADGIEAVHAVHAVE
jgi:two-component system OmpR family sensor kinase